MTDKFDAIDVQILALLQKDGRMSQADLAREVSLSPASVLARLRRLEQAGVIRDYMARLNAPMLGFSLTVFVEVQLSLHHERPIEQFRKAVKELPEVLECHHVSGNYDYLLKVVARDMSSYERFVREKLSTIKAVGRIHSCFVMKTTKDQCILPLE